jgi:hypothetical protein
VSSGFLFTFLFFHLIEFCSSIGYTNPVLLCSSKARPQAWHLDSPLPNVFVNLVYLDDGQMTQFMVPCALPSSIQGLKAPASEVFAPCAISSEDGQTLMSENWLTYIEKR